MLPQLRKLEGFLGLSVCEAEQGDRVEILVISRWASMDAIKAFAGPKPERAVVDPGAWARSSASSTISPPTTRCCWTRRTGMTHGARRSGQARRGDLGGSIARQQVAFGEFTLVGAGRSDRAPC